MGMNEAIKTIRNYCASVGCEKCAYHEKGCYFNTVKPLMWNAPKFSDEDIEYIKSLEKMFGDSEIVKVDGAVFLAQRRLLGKHFMGMRNGERYTLSEIISSFEKGKRYGKTV